MDNITEVLRKYTAGEKTIEEVMAAVDGTGLTFDREKNAISESERSTHGLLLTGTGSVDKVAVKNGEISIDLGVMGGELCFNGKMYDIVGNKLAPYTPYNPKDAKWKPDPGMLHRPKYANQVVIKGRLRYRYDENGDATYEPVSMAEYDKDHGVN